MNRIIVIIATLFLFSFKSVDYKAIRVLMISAVSDKSVSEAFYKETRGFNSSSEAIFIGYKAMAEFIQCKHTINPFLKLSYFSAGKSNLEAAIAKQPNNIELIFFRFSTQVNVPSFLSYTSNIESDKKVLIKFVKESKKDDKIDWDLHSKIKAFILQCAKCSEADKKSIS